MAWFAAFRGRNYDKIFFWQQYIGLYYYAIITVLPILRRSYIVYYIIAKKRKSFVGRIVEKQFTGMVIASEKSYFMSSSDYLFRKLNITEYRNRIELLNELDLTYPYIDLHRNSGISGEYIFAGGSGNRKYADVAAIAVTLPAERFVVACRLDDVARISFSKNVAVHYDAYGDRFADLILHSKAVLLPLADPDVMSGQLVCIQAFAANKTVIISENNCLRDWIATIDQLDFVTLYQTIEECVDHIRGLDLPKALEAGGRARRFYDDTLTNTGFYERLATQIAASARSVAVVGAP
ncbi:hypothetical protein [Sphingomonas sp. ZB1N12]|uniref:hypothetical protein n=1 Tax=Sphingomonas arabinosi TaxID=3096160 RepID=UPI002FC8E91B